MPILTILRARAGGSAFLLLLYSVAVTLPHQAVQDWLLVVAVKPLGAATFYRMMAGLAFSALTVAGLLAVRRLRQHPARKALSASSAFTLVLVLIAWRWLSVNNSELVHFPQYVVTGLVLMALTLSVTDSLSWVLLLGGIDEAYQYAVIHPAWGIPYDFNDVTLDLLGGAIGVLLCTFWLQAKRRSGGGWRLGAGSIALAVVVVAGGLMLATNQAVLYADPARTDYWFALSRLPVKGFWFFDATWGPRTIHALTPVEGPALLLGILFVYSRLDQWFEFRSP